MAKMKQQSNTSHSERAHSKFSASGAERWFNCPGSVQIQEGLPDKNSVYSIDGTKAHEVLEKTFEVLLGELTPGAFGKYLNGFNIKNEMKYYANRAANFILTLQKQLSGAELLVESRVYLDFIHPEMFGTLDSAIVEHFGTLHVLDYKYGQGKKVSPKENLQMIFYAIAVAAKYNWNFKNVRLWIIQPRVKGYDGPLFWDLGILELKAYVRKFKEAVDRVEHQPNKLVEGDWCYFCKANNTSDKGCPLKQKVKLEKARNAFSNAPIN